MVSLCINFTLVLKIRLITVSEYWITRVPRPARLVEYDVRCYKLLPELSGLRWVN